MSDIIYSSQTQLSISSLYHRIFYTDFSSTNNEDNYQRELISFDNSIINNAQLLFNLRNSNPSAAQDNTEEERSSHNSRDSLEAAINLAEKQKVCNNCNEYDAGLSKSPRTPNT